MAGIKRLILLLAFAIGAGLQAQQGLTHHSRATFQLDNLVEMRGTVTNFRWANPHIYWEMELDNGETWTIEGHSVPGALGIGWTKDTIQVGDDLRVGVYPDDDTDTRFALVEWVVAADGLARRAFGNRPLPEELQAIAATTPQPRGRGPGRPEIPPSTDFSGNWRIDLRGLNLRTGVFSPAQDLPLTDLGQQVFATYDDSENPGYQCVQASMPLAGPYGIRFDRYDDRLVITKETSTVPYTIWLDESAAPAAGPPSRLGTAVGTAEGGDTLVFEVTNFVADKWGLSRGLDSSDEKHVSGRFELQPNGRAINYSYVISDPVYLTEPLTRSGVLLKELDREFVNEACDPEISSLHLSFD